MKQNNTRPKSPRESWRVPPPITIGIDLGDKTSRYCALAGEEVREGSMSTTKKAMLQKFSAIPRCRIAIESGRTRVGSTGC